MSLTRKLLIGFGVMLGLSLLSGGSALPIVHEQVTQQTAASAEKGASAGTELNRYATTLQGLVREMRDMLGSD